MQRILVQFLFIPTLLLVVSAIVFIPDAAMAQATTTTGFVPCEGAGCNFCHFVVLANNIIAWLIGVLAVVFGVMVFAAGIGLVTSGGNPGKLEDAKKSLTNALIGLIIVLAAWLIIDTLLKATLQTGPNIAPWEQIQCSQSQLVGDAFVPQASNSTSSTPALCSDDAALLAQYGGSPIGLVNPQLTTMVNCYLADSAVSNLVDSNQIYTVDRSYPRCSLTRGSRVCGPCSHSNGSAHYGNGTGARAVDFNSIGSESSLLTALTARRSVCGGSILFEGDHTHISL